MASENPFMLDLRDNSTKTIQIPDDKLGAIKELSELTLEQLQEAGVSIFPSPSSEDEAEGYKRGLTRNDCILRLSEGDKQGYQIQTNNLVGFVSYQGTSITIRSRFAKKDGNDFFLHYLMLKTLRLSTIDLPMPVSDSESILNLLLLLFPSYLTRAVSQGIFKQYQRFHYNDYRPKGTIDVARHIKCNVPFRGKIAYNTREQSYDNPVTQLVRHTIEVIRNKPGYGSLLTVNPEVAAAVRQIELATPSFVRKDLVSVVNANHRPCSHPLLTEYLPLQQLCLKILRNEDEGLRNMFTRRYPHYGCQRVATKCGLFGGWLIHLSSPQRLLIADVISNGKCMHRALKAVFHKLAGIVAYHLLGQLGSAKTKRIGFTANCATLEL